ncbi:hypothetical protein [Heyndrickxia camelliae]|uniref:DUF4304 domain-containing protein n=1 Tax=Heyndrickxia camelliae TaxID=1707093 RepID=A0A2N3LL39_9BACI|nr:hypothetical protein [Heyndrickxia camelliae]PKR85340.1 hypothetical protein CWO92_09095 [Heyndrickxia camelliae]
MMIRNKVDRKIKRILLPILREYGFISMNCRNYYALHKECIWVLNLDHVGNYISDLSGWSAQSLNAMVGIYFNFIPPIWNENNRREKFPTYDECQLQMELCSQKWQKDNTWWFCSDGKNMEEIMDDIKNTFLLTGVPWLERYSNIEHAFKKIEGEVNSYHKFYKAKCFAKHLKQWDKYEKYDRLFRNEAIKFGE